MRKPQLALISLMAFILGSLSYAITNGRSISEDASPAISFIEINENGHSGICTGVAVGDGVILTAEHCAFVAKASSIRINKTYLVKKIFVGDFHYRDEKLDLALLEIDKGVLKAQMPIFNGPLPDNSQSVVIAGYGMAFTGDDKMTYDDAVVKRAGVNIMNPAMTNNLYINLKFEMGTNDPTKPAGALPGDSGGPMIYNKYVVGIASKSVFGISNYTNLTSEVAKKFFKAADDAGWKLNYSNH